MFNLLKKSRDGEAKDKHSRSDRFFSDNNNWFFRTREGQEVGPFFTRSDAQHALLYFIERNEWPNEEELREFIEGCQLSEGI